MSSRTKVTSALLSAVLLLTSCAPAAVNASSEAAASAAEEAVTIAAAATAAAVTTAAEAAKSAEAAEATADETAAAESSRAAEETSAGASVQTEEVSVYKDGAPWLDANIDGVLTDDVAADPKDDFNLAINADTIRSLTFDPGKASTGNLSEAARTVDKNKLALIKDESDDLHEAVLLRQMYKAMDDWDAREKAAQEKVREGMTLIEGLSSMKEYCDYISDWKENMTLDGLYSSGLAFASDDASVWILSTGGTSLLLGDPAEYTERTEYGQLLFDMEKDIYTYAVDTIGINTAVDVDMEAFIDFESVMAEHMMTENEKMRSEAIELMDNYLTIDEIDELLGPNCEYRKELEKNGHVPEHKILVAEPEQLKCIGEILSDESYLPALKNWLKVRFLMSRAPELSRQAMLDVTDIRNAYNGVAERRDYEYMLADEISSALNIPMQRAYVDKYATKEMKYRITEMCRNVAAEYCEMLSEIDWLADETKQAAIRKLETLKIKAVYPEKWQDFSGLDFEGLDYYGIYKAINAFSCDYSASQLNQKIDSEIWLSDTTQTNACYMPSENSITIFMGILGDKTFTTEMSTEEAYGRIGAVIGHEISHAFDSSGSQYDEYGNLSNWWTESDKASFDSRVQKVRAYFDKISIYGNKYLTGTKLDGEATADITGIQCILRMAKDIPDFDYDTFFRAYADLWAGKDTPSRIEMLYIYDPHPPKYTRVNVTLQQFDEFYETYDIKEGDGMYLAPEDRIKVW